MTLTTGHCLNTTAVARYKSRPGQGYLTDKYEACKDSKRRYRAMLVAEKLCLLKTLVILATYDVCVKCAVISVDTLGASLLGANHSV